MKNFYIITGASSGIGFALCCHLVRRNHHVIAIARNERNLNSLKALYPELITFINADLATVESREKIISHIPEAVNIKGLVNNAASNQPISLLQNLPLIEWQQQIEINLNAPLFLTQKLLPFMKNGRIINLTSGMTNFVASGAAGYAMTKAAINVFSKYLHEELNAQGIRVAAAHPGIVKTGLIDNIVTNNHAHAELEVYKVQQQFQKNNLYLDVNLSAKFLYWLLVEADDQIYTGDIIGIYNKKYQPFWHDGEIIPSPYPDHIAPP